MTGQPDGATGHHFAVRLCLPPAHEPQLLRSHLRFVAPSGSLVAISQLKGDSGMVKLIPLGLKKPSGLFAIVDEDQFERLSAFAWYPRRDKHTTYARRKIKKNGKWTETKLHDDLMPCPPGQTADHINQDGLDNRRSNLRCATPAQQCYNRRPLGKSGFKGVYFKVHANQARPWSAEIKHCGRSIYLGAFGTKEEAARAYDRKAVELWGAFAYLNFPIDYVEQSDAA